CAYFVKDACQTRQERRVDGRARRDHRAGASHGWRHQPRHRPRVLLEPDSFIATAVYEDGAALERQESRPEVHKVMAMLPESLAAPLERTIFDASLDPALV